MTPTGPTPSAQQRGAPVRPVRHRNKTYWRLPGLGEAQVGHISGLTVAWVGRRKVTFTPN